MLVKVVFSVIVILRLLLILICILLSV
jgi:hypothetical protein